MMNWTCFRVYSGLVSNLNYPMKFEEHCMYHIHNEGNKGELIFYNEDNYELFKSKVRKYLVPYCDLVSYCLLPNSFDLMIHANALTEKEVRIGVVKMSLFSEGIKNLLSSYTKSLNRFHLTTGSIFRQNTKCLLLDEDNNVSSRGMFHYIHQLPVMMGVVNNVKEWRYSSHNDYFGSVRSNLFNVTAGRKLLEARGIQCRPGVGAEKMTNHKFLRRLLFTK